MGGSGSGRAKKPSELKKLEGNRAALGQGKIMTDPRGKGRPRPPPGLSGEALGLWRDVVSSLPEQLLTRADEGALEGFAVAWQTMREANRRIDGNGLVISTPAGDRENPFLRIRDKAIDQIVKLGGVLGLSPVARARLASRDPIGDEDPLALLLGADGDPDGAWSIGPSTKQ